MSTSFVVQHGPARSKSCRFGPIARNSVGKTHLFWVVLRAVFLQSDVHLRNRFFRINAALRRAAMRRSTCQEAKQARSMTYRPGLPQLTIRTGSFAAVVVIVIAPNDPERDFYHHIDCAPQPSIRH